MAHAVDHEKSALAWAPVLREGTRQSDCDARGDVSRLVVLLIGRLGRACATYLLYVGLRSGIDTRAPYPVGLTGACSGGSCGGGGRSVGAARYWILVVVFSGRDFVCGWGCGQ